MSDVLVFGRNGQVARELSRAGLPDGLGQEQVDISVPGACRAAIGSRRPSAVINAAAFTDVDGAETAEAKATAINGVAPGEMAVACAELGIPFVHISTDYVFDGSGTNPWKPDDPVGPLGAYGRSKLVGEQAVRDAAGQFVILRTSWVFSAHGKNFVKTMLRLGAERDELSIVADQIGGPTSAASIAQACITGVQALRSGAPSGTYHFSGGPDVSWADFARAIFDLAGLNCRVTDIPASAYPTPAQRPGNSRMDCSDLQLLGLTRPDWQEGLRKVLDEVTSA